MVVASAAMSNSTVIRAIIISQGEELLTGQTLDTNASFLAGRLTDLGVSVRGVVTAGDRVVDIADAVREAAARVEVVICTGGLGPTADDLTAEAVCAALELPLERDDEALRQVQATFERWGREMVEANRKQALLPRGAEVVPNPLGTAPGFTLTLAAGAQGWFLPGVPLEMKRMWSDSVEPAVRARFSPRSPHRHLFRVSARGESNLQELLGPLVARHEGVVLGFRARMPENQVKLVSEGQREPFEAAVAEVREALGRHCFSQREDVGLAATVGALLLERGERLALAESCTGGLLADLCVSVPGSSHWLDRGWVTYSNEAKVSDLGVPQEIIEQHGAVSEPCALAMARGARDRAAVAWGLSTTGIAGPGGGTELKPVGTICIAVVGPAVQRVKTLHLHRDRAGNRHFSAWLALDLLRRQLIG